MSVGLHQAAASAALLPAAPAVLLHAVPAPIASRWPRYEADEIAAVEVVLRSGRVNALHHGTLNARLQDGFAALCAMPHAIAVANGTLALELALYALKVGRGDEVIVPARSFVASASCVVTSGATPVFADVDPETQALSAETIAAQLTRRTKAIIVVHLGGRPADMAPIVALARAHGLLLIEDCAQAHGATIDGQAVGGFGDAAAFSFCTDKIMSTGGEGGLLLLRDEAAWRRAWSMKDHGKDVRDLGGGGGNTGFRWLHHEVGSNYRLTEMQAAIGVAQLAKLPAWLDARRRNAAAILAPLRGLDAVRLVEPPAEVGHAYYKFYAFVRPETLAPGWTRDRIVAEAIARGVPCLTGSCPEIYRERAFVERGLGRDTPLPVAKLLGETSLMLPVDPTLDEEECRYMGETVRAIALEATGRTHG
ncbi:DegT/DnrJ/EryC1/StrS family aminotransferase [Sphingomonas phyllosphaerae]|uniref:DegT/DnrJ/EryC1/StrS family aminotransferase n=1 Tax=Sphingomonas phyllosphaerae TaxID=257003 RepID=UPI0024135A89|nr:DegT/DnrJ/EryC1/StrS aminotransferase family protein [Sphingomonas phyllosphaerae]